MLHPLCDFQCPPHPWPWPWIFKVKFWKCCISGMGWADWHGMKGMWIDRMLHPLCGFQHSPHPWPWPWIFEFKFWKSYISGMGWLIDMELKGCESIECWTHAVTFNVHLTHDLYLGFSRSNFEKVVSQEWVADWHGTKVMWVDRMLHPLCDFQCPLHPWPWPWIFKVKFLKCCISGMGGQIDMERKGFASTECWTHVVTFNFHLFHDLDLGFSEKVVSQEWDGRLTWNERDMSR